MSTRPLLATALAALLGAAPVAASELYRVDTELRHEGVAIGAPSLVVRPGEAGTVGISGADGYTLTVRVRPDAGDALRVDGEVARTASDAPPEVFAMVVVPGQTAQLDAGALGIALTVTPTAPGTR